MAVLVVQINSRGLIMNSIFKGMIFIFLSINFTFGNSKIDLLPDFIGYFMILNGLEELYNQSENFIKIKPFVLGLGIYSVITLILNLAGITTELGYIAVIAGILYTIFLIYITYKIILGIMDIEKKINKSLNTEKLMSNWKLMITFNILTFITIFIPVLAIICLIVYVVFVIAYLIAFNTTKNLYYENNGNLN